jgi:hypothetical protein
LAFDRLAASGAPPRQSEIERGAPHRAHGANPAFEPRRGSKARQLPHRVSHRATLSPRDGLVTFHFWASLRAFSRGT